MKIDVLGFTLEVDENAGAAYITLSDQQVHKTICFADIVNLDVDDQGRPVGVEILD